MFERWEKVIDVHITKKRNKLWRIFAFVRYACIKNEEWLEKQMNDIWFE